MSALERELHEAQPQPEKRYYTEKEFCELLGIGRRTALEWRNQRKIGFVRMPGGGIRYLRKHIEEFEQRNERKARERKPRQTEHVN